ncbi:uncharacterized protein VTP21DRAFT_4431 [Calcarisporiella thermophila]|uniref:uncharacterized protein n=1 Tax=Calcarisporiella thermophila TaxID=911321 RepID=UPI00374343B7
MIYADLINTITLRGKRSGFGFLSWKTLVEAFTILAHVFSSAILNSIINQLQPEGWHSLRTTALSSLLHFLDLRKPERILELERRGHDEDQKLSGIFT